MNFGERIKTYRIENKLTQKEFSNMLGVSRTLISDVESGRIKGTLTFINKVADVTGKSLNYWTNGDKELEKNYVSYEALDILIDSLIDTDMVSEDGKLNEPASKLILNVLEKEIALKIKRKKEQD